MRDERVVFYRLTHRFVNQEQDIPEDARRVVYYSLAIGHHVGVLDCFHALLDIPLEEYRRWVADLAEGPARHKLEGVLKWGEIEINRSHVGALASAIRRSANGTNGMQPTWVGILSRCLQEMNDEPAMYLMARKRT
jgi:hydrogenase-4 component J